MMFLAFGRILILKRFVKRRGVLFVFNIYIWMCLGVNSLGSYLCVKNNIHEWRRCLNNISIAYIVVWIQVRNLVSMVGSFLHVASLLTLCTSVFFGGGSKVRLSVRLGVESTNKR